MFTGRLHDALFELFLLLQLLLFLHDLLHFMLQFFGVHLSSNHEHAADEHQYQ